MLEFSCPYCGGKQYSSYEHYEEKWVNCNECGLSYLNVYYREDRNNASMDTLQK